MPGYSTEPKAWNCLYDDAGIEHSYCAEKLCSLLCFFYPGVPSDASVDPNVTGQWMDFGKIKDLPLGKYRVHLKLPVQDAKPDFYLALQDEQQLAA